MSRLLLILALIVIALPSAARGDPLSNRAPAKPVRVVVPPPADPEVIRQGGDTIEDATIIAAIPYDNTGTTAGYTDDYDEVCPYSISTSPDVVYTFTPTGAGIAVDIDLFGSAYDTKLYVYDGDMNLIACNDDFYPDYVSKLENVALMGGMQYFIVVDGYGGDFGDYVMAITEGAGPCVVECPPEGILEGEPDLVDGYVDDYNGGCNSDGPPWPFQDLNGSGQAFLEFCGIAGWYVFEGSNYRDTDWFTAVISEMGFIEITADAESATTIFEVEVTEDCDATVLWNMTVGPCAPGSMTAFGYPGAVVYFWVGSANTSNPGDIPGNMYDYTLTLDSLSATESSTWSQVKGLYR